MTVQEVDRAWLAGLFDGDGSLALCRRLDRRNGNLCHLWAWRIAMTDHKAIDKTVAILTQAGITFQRGVSQYNAVGKRKEVAKAFFVMSMAKGPVRQMVELMLPYLVTKKEIAERCLASTEIQYKQVSQH